MRKRCLCFEWGPVFNDEWDVWLKSQGTAAFSLHHPGTRMAINLIRILILWEVFKTG